MLGDAHSLAPPRPARAPRLRGHRVQAGRWAGPEEAGLPVTAGFPGQTDTPHAPPPPGASALSSAAIAQLPLRPSPSALPGGRPTASCSWCPPGPRVPRRTATCPRHSAQRGFRLTCQLHPGSRSPRPLARRGTQPGSGQSPPRSGKPVSVHEGQGSAWHVTGWSGGSPPGQGAPGRLLTAGTRFLSSALSFGARAAGASFHTFMTCFSSPGGWSSARRGGDSRGTGREATAHRPEALPCPGSP